MIDLIGMAEYAEQESLDTILKDYDWKQALYDLAWEIELNEAFIHIRVPIAKQTALMLMNRPDQKQLEFNFI